MKPLICYENLRNFAYSNDAIISGNIRGIVVDFKGLGNMEMVDGQNHRGAMFAGKGILYVMPYNNPWNWMNAQAVSFTDEIIDVLKAKYASDDVDVVASGGSMGGLCALMYSKYSKHKVAACVANCPVCDLPFHFTERPDLPRTLYSALWYSDADDMETALAERSPLHQASAMPDIPYTIFHCDADEAVNIHSHSEKFVEEMRRRGRNVEFRIVKDRGHCDLDDISLKMYDDAIISVLT